MLYLITNDISARFLRGQLGFLIDHGFEVHVGTRLSGTPAEFDEGVVVHDLELVREPHPWHDVRSLVSILRLTRRLRPEVVNASTPKAGLLGMIAARLCRVPRRLYVVRGLRFETLTGVRHTMMRLLERLATACATDVVFNSRSLLATAEGRGAVKRGRGVVLGHGSGNGIDTARYRQLPTRSSARSTLGIATDGPVIGFVGRLTRDKGIVDLVEAMNRDERLCLLLVGDFEAGDPLPIDTQRAITESSKITHIPWMDDTRIAYRAMDVLAFPSYREGLPNVPLEAQLCGVPVVAYAATGTVDAVADEVGGLLVPVGDRDALRDAIERALETPELGSAGERWVTERFDQQQVWANLAQLLAGSDA